MKIYRGFTVFIVLRILLVLLLSSFSATDNHFTLKKPNISHDKAKLIAQLNDGVNGYVFFHVDSVSLTSNKKYWIVKMHEGKYHLKVTVNAKDGTSKKNNGRWKSFNELKARYIAEYYGGDGGFLAGTPKIIMLKEKKFGKQHYILLYITNMVK